MIKNNSSVIEEVETDVETLKKMMSELGISLSNEDTYKLILWNDDVNDMLYVITALSDICELTKEECVKIMLDAHENGKSIAKIGTFDDMNSMKDALNLRKINASVEK